DAERDDRERNRLEPELGAAQPAQCADLHQVVEPEREHSSAGGSGAAGSQATRATRAAGRRKQLLPPERAEDVACEVERDRSGDEPHVRALQRPARVREAPPEEDASADRHRSEGKREGEPTGTWTVSAGSGVAV